MSVVVAPEVAQFVAAVRAELADLDPEVVEELTGGLEADLTDSLEAAPGNGFGDPAAYAAELRSAAGLPPRATPSARVGTLGPAALAALLLQQVAVVAERVTGHPRWPAVRDFVVTLRPVWWVARAWAVYAVVVDAVLQSEDVRTIPRTPAAILILLALTVVSVRIGRRCVDGTIGRWRWPLLLGNLVALVLLPLLLADAGRPFPARIEYVDGGSMPSDGLYSNGNPVTNVLPYDSNGQPLTGVQLFDQDGTPLAVAPNSSNNTVQNADGLSEGLPLVDANGEARWNVFPLRERPVDPAQPVPSPSLAVTAVPVPPSPSAPTASAQPPSAPSAPSAPAPSTSAP